MTRVLQNHEILEEQTTIIQKMGKLELELSKILDLEEVEASIYLNLLRVGPVTASFLAKEFHLDRTKVYRTIDKLLNLKIISTTFSKPKLCVANKLEDVFKDALQRKESQATRIRDESDHIIKSIKETIPTNFASSLPTFHISQGTSNIYYDIEKLIENAKDTVYIVTSLKDLSKMYHTNIPEKIEICEKNGGEVRLLTQTTSCEFLPYVCRFGATETRIGELGSEGRMIVEKGNQMIMSDVDWGDSDEQDIQHDHAICTNSSEMVNNIFVFCNLLWKNSKPLTIRKPKIR